MDEREAAAGLRTLARRLGERGWLPATSGNLSILVEREPLAVAVTRSGADKQHLKDEDVLIVGSGGRVVRSASATVKPSAETAVHMELYGSLQDCGCILHVHTMFNNLVSQWYFPSGYAPLRDHELLKALDDWTPDASMDVPVVANLHDLDALARAVRDAIVPGTPGVLVRNHGIYAWGETPAAALRHLEAFEFLFEYDIRRRSLGVRP